MSTLDMPQPDNADDSLPILISQPKVKLIHAFKGLIQCIQEPDITIYSVNTSFFWVSIIYGNIPIEMKRSLLKLLDIHDILFVCLKLVHLQQSWNEGVARKLRDFAVKLAQMNFNVSSDGKLTMNDEVVKVLQLDQNKALKDVYVNMAQYAVGLKWIPIPVAKITMPLAFTLSIRMINAHKVLLRPIDEDINKVTAEELLERIAQVEAELEKLISTSDK